MMSTITQLPFGLFLVLLNLPFLYFGYKQIGKNFAIATTIAICFLSGWSAVFEPIRQVTEDPFLAAIFGGIGHPLGAVVAGVILGIVQEVATPFVGFTYKIALSFVVLLAVLLVRPKGLFGTAEGAR